MKTQYRCPICHGTNIQVRAWVDATTNEYITDCDDGEGWCEDCETEIILEENEDE